MPRMENQTSEVTLKACFVSTLLLLLIAVLVYISVQLSNELNQVSQVKLGAKLLILTIKHLQITQQNSKAQDNVGKLRHLVSLCRVRAENKTKHIDWSLENIENRREKHRDLVRDREYCSEDLANLTVLVKSLARPLYINQKYNYKIL